VAGLAVLALLRVSTPVPAGGEVRVLVTETDPALPATLGHWHRFNVRFGYESDRPIRVQGQAYWQGRNVTSITGGSPVYPTGTGDGMFWFAYTAPAQVDRIVLTVYEENRQTSVAQASLDVELRWTGEKTPRPAVAAWVQRLDAEAARRQQEAYQAHANQPPPLWQWGLSFALVWSPVGYLVAQIIAWRRLHGGWRVAAFVPIVPMVMVLLHTVRAYRAGSTLFPLVLIFTSPVALIYLLALIVARRYRRRSVR